MPELLDRLRTPLADRYRLERELGAGGMATVYLAEDLKHHRQVAIKVLNPELAALLGPERFLREIEIAARLNHPHILPLLDSGEADGFLYYVMPYVEGESLRDRLNREKQLPVEDALQIAREVADALDYAHRHDVVHRDIKPENILLQERHAVVADFGIARAISVAGGEKLTATGVAVGTPEYMSPEQASGRGELDGRSDIYALGCVLYEMLAGQPPFTGPTVESVVHQHLASEAPDVTQMRRAVSAECVLALRRALEKAPADRFGTGAAFAHALQAGIGAPRRAWRPARRRAAIALGIAALALVAGIGLWRPWAAGPRGASAAPPRIVVLPFDNLGAAEDEYFADGMTEEITSRLAQVPSLAVIGRTSAMQYKGAGKSLRTIGEELRVQYVLEGTVRWSVEGGERRLRITPQLIRVADEAHVWADRYDAVFADVFAVQGRIASQVVTALGATLAPAAASVAETTPPTRNSAAYEEYLRGNALYAQCAVACAEAREAAQHYEEAVRLDPDFAVAWARLSLTTTMGIRPGVAAPARATEAAARAMDLAADLPDAHIALGRLYYATPEQDLTRAEAAFRRALELRPNHLEGLRWLGLAYRRGGHMEAAADVLVRHADLDPRDERAQYDAGITLQRLRRYDHAERYLQRHVALRPGPHRRLATLHLMRDGDTVSARRVMLARVLTTPGTMNYSPGEWWYNAADGFLEFDRLLCDSLCARAARDWLTRTDAPVAAESIFEWRPYGDRGVAARLAGDQGLATAYLDSALLVVENLIRRNPTLQAHTDRAGLLAWLGRREAAIQAARELVRRDPISEDATNGPGAINVAAEIFALFGEDEQALEQLEVVLSVPSYNSVPLVRVNPVWQRFKTNPRFQALLTKYDTPRR